MFNRFYRLEIHLIMVGIFDPACELLPSWTKELYTCVLLPIYLLSDLPFSQTKCGGVGGFSCVVDHILQEFYTLFLTRARICRPFKEPRYRLPAWRPAGRYENHVGRTGPPGYMGWRNRFLGIDACAP